MADKAGSQHGQQMAEKTHEMHAVSQSKWNLGPSLATNRRKALLMPFVTSWLDDKAIALIYPTASNYRRATSFDASVLPYRDSATHSHWDVEGISIIAI